LNYIEEDLISNLKKQRIDLNKGTHFIWEGKSPYLLKEDINRLGEKIRSSFTGYLSLTVDYVTEDLVQERTNY